MQAEVMVIGGGIVGAAIAYGLLRRGRRVLVLDGEDNDHRAARANFGLVWVQGKGDSMPAYQSWTRRSSELWGAFASELEDVSGQDVQLEQRGGLSYCLDESEFEERRNALQKLHNQLGGEAADWEMIERPQLEQLLPGVALGPDVCGASLGRRDGHANPLRLHVGLLTAIQRLGGTILGGQQVQTIRSSASGFTVNTLTDSHSASRIVIAAGLGSQALGRQVGLDVPVRPQRGQILVTERLAPFLPLPGSGLRQTREGSVMIGATQEEVGLDASTTSTASVDLSYRALQVVPALAGATLVRQWAGLRILTPDSYPVYAQSQSHPGAFIALCHSGVTLAAIHAQAIAEAIIGGALPASLDSFHHRRFDVSQAA